MSFEPSIFARTSVTRAARVAWQLAAGILAVLATSCGGEGLPSAGTLPPVTSGTAPLAVASASDTSGEAPVEIVFDARSSVDPDGDITTFQWDFGDGSDPAHGETVRHLFEAEGEYTVVLTVMDLSGNPASADVLVTVSGAPPAPEPDPEDECPEFLGGTAAGSVASSSINEASGIAASRKTPGVLWVHNDSGDSPRVFALDSTGADLGTYAVGGASARDWEDIALGPGPEDGVDYLYLADTGDNGRSRSYVVVYRVPEPDVDSAAAAGSYSIAGTVRLEMTYPEGPTDAECLWVDPRTADIWIATKRSDGVSRLYRNSFPQPEGQRVEMELMGTLAFGTAALPGSKLVTGGDMSPSGDLVIIKTYSSIFVWRRGAGETVAEALAGEPCKVPVRSERQGEAVGFAGDGGGYFTVSEGSHPALYFFERL